MRFRHTIRSVRWTPAPVATAAVLALAALGATPTPARSQAFVCTPAAVLCEVVDNRSVNIAGRTISTLAEPSPLAFELRGPRARIVNHGTAELEGTGWIIGINTSFGSPNTPWQLVNGNDERPDDPATLRLRSPGELRIGTGLRQIAGRVEVVEGRAWVGGFLIEAGEVSIAAGASFTSVGDTSYRGNRRFMNDGVLDIGGRLFNTVVTGDLDLGAGQTILRGAQVLTRGRISSAGNLRFDRSGGDGIEVQADLEVRGDTVIDIRQPSIPGGDQLWLNGSFAARTASFHNLNILNGVLRVSGDQRVEVTGDLAIGDRIRLDTLANGGIVMRARPGDASEARLIVGNETPWTSGELLTVDRPVVLSGAIPRGVSNRSVIGLQGSGGPDPFAYRISLGAFDNLGRLEARNDTRLDIDNDAGGSRLGGVLAVADRAVLRIHADRPGNPRYEIATLENWNAGTGALTGGRFEINGATLVLAGSATTLRNESRLELTKNARIATDAGDIREYDNRSLLIFDGVRDQIVRLDNSTHVSQVNFVSLFGQFVVVQTLRNAGVVSVFGDANGQLRVFDLVSEGAPGQPHTLGWRDGRLAGGIYEVLNGSLLIQNGFGPVHALASQVTLGGSTARLEQLGVPGSALAPLALIERAGVLSLFNGASFQSQAGAEFVNQGRLTVGAGSSFVAGTSLRQSSGFLRVDGTLDGDIAWVGGILDGTGRINGSLFVPGAISGAPPVFIPMAGNPGMSVAGRMDDEPPPEPVPTGPLTISGAVELADTAVVAVAVPDDLSAMPVLAFGAEGGITLAGTLRVDFSGSGGFMQPAQLTFMQLVGNVVGQFAALEVIGGAGKVAGVSYALVFDDASGITTGVLDVSPVPEPGTWALMLLGAAGIAARVRRPRPASPSGV